MAEGAIRHNEIIEIDKTLAGIKKIIKELKKLQGIMRQTAKETITFQQKQDPSTKRGKAGTQQATSQVAKLTQQNERLAQSLRTVTQEQVRLKKARKDMNTEIRRQVQVLGAAKGSLDRNRVALQKMSERMGRATPEAARKMEKRMNALTNKIKAQETAVQRHQRNVGNYSGAFGKALKAAKSFGAGIIGVTSLISVFSRGVKIAIESNREFEKTFTNVLTLLNKNQISDFGKELEKGVNKVIIKFGIGIGEANKALFDLVSAGVEAGDAIVFLNKAAELSIAGNSDLGSVVLGITKIMNAYALSADDATKISEALFAAQVKGQTTVQELAASIGTATSAASIADIGFDELLATFAVLTKRLRNTDEAATAINATITALMKADKMPAVADAFRRAGIEAGTTALKTNGLFETLVQISNAAEEDADILSELIPNIRALRGVGALTTEALVEFQEILSLVNDEQQSAEFFGNALNMQLETEAKRVDVRNQKLLFAARIFRNFTPLQKEYGDNVFAAGAATKEETTALDENTRAKEDNLAVLKELERIEAIRQERIKKAKEEAAAEARRIELQKALTTSIAATAETRLLDQQEGDSFFEESMSNIEAVINAQAELAARTKNNSDAAIAQIEHEQSLRTETTLAGLAADKKKTDSSKKAAEAEQKISLGQSIVALAQGVANTVKAGFPINIPLLIGYFAQTFGILATIKSVKFAEGGHGELGGERHSQGGTHLPGVGEAERGEYFGIINRQMTRKYSQDLPMIFDSLNSGKFHDVWDNANIQLQTNIDPWTKKIFDTLQATPSIYTDTKGDTVKEYPNGRKRVIRKAT